MLLHHGEQLAVNVFPLAYAADVDEVLAQELFVLAVRKLVSSHAPSRIVNPLPQLEVTSELTFFVIKLLVRRIGLLLRLHGAVAHVLHAQGAGNHQGLVQRAALAGFKQHAAHPRVQWQAAELLAQGGELMGIVHRTQLIEQLVAVGNGAACGGL